MISFKAFYEWYHAAEVRILAYADDVGVFYTYYESVCQVVQVVKRFREASGSSVHWGKPLGFWHGNWPVFQAIFASMQWVPSPFRHLGVLLLYYQDIEPYWREQAAILREMADSCKGWGMPVFALATVCHLFLASKVSYVLQVLHCLRVNLQKIHRVFVCCVRGGFHAGKNKQHKSFSADLRRRSRIDSFVFEATG